MSYLLHEFRKKIRKPKLVYIEKESISARCPFCGNAGSEFRYHCDFCDKSGRVRTKVIKGNLIDEYQGVESLVSYDVFALSHDGECEVRLDG